MAYFHLWQHELRAQYIICLVKELSAIVIKVGQKFTPLSLTQMKMPFIKITKVPTSMSLEFHGKYVSGLYLMNGR